MTTNEQLNAIRHQLMRWQGGKCERCGKPLGQTVHFIRIYANEGGVPAWIRPGHMMAVHPACAIAPDPQHTRCVPGCECANCAELKAEEEDRGPRRNPLDVRRPGCGAEPRVPCGQSQPVPSTDGDAFKYPRPIKYVAGRKMFDCPHCGSAAGQTCRTSSGHPTQPHKARVRR